MGNIGTYVRKGAVIGALIGSVGGLYEAMQQTGGLPESWIPYVPSDISFNSYREMINTGVILIFKDTFIGAAGGVVVGGLAGLVSKLHR